MTAVATTTTLNPAVHASVAAVHALASAGWFGSMVYSLTVLQPRAKSYFADDQRFEEFVATVSRGARWKVLSAFAVVLFSGVALIPLTRPDPSSRPWLVLVITKVVLFAVSLVVFCYASWRLWPARIFATPEEVPAFQRRFRRVGVSMILLVGANLVLGVVAHTYR